MKLDEWKAWLNEYGPPDMEGDRMTRLGAIYAYMVVVGIPLTFFLVIWWAKQ